MSIIALIVGFVRCDRQGIKDACWMKEEIADSFHTLYFFDPLELNLSLLDRMYGEMVDPSEKMRTLWNEISECGGDILQ